jgi:hypothetical protein
MSVSENVVIMTKDELEEIKHTCVQVGFQRGKFEASQTEAIEKSARATEQVSKGALIQICDLLGVTNQPEAVARIQSLTR